jgi:hypothetical protein
LDSEVPKARFLKFRFPRNALVSAPRFFCLERRRVRALPLARDMPPLSHPRASWPEHAPRPRRTARDYTDVVVLSVMVFVLVAYASLEKLFPQVVPSERPSHARRLSFAVTSSVGWNTPASEGEIVTTKGLKGFETSYAVYFGEKREKRDAAVAAETEGPETPATAALTDGEPEDEEGALEEARTTVAVGGPTRTNSGVGAVLT